MAKLKVIALDTALVEGLQSGGLDAPLDASLDDLGNVPERHVSDGGGNPCRHCLTDMAAGESMLIFSHQPFPRAQAHAEIGPIFVHAKSCDRHLEDAGLPSLFQLRDQYLIRAYSDKDRIAYAAGGVVDVEQLQDTCERILDDTSVAYLHIRSASYNCYQCRVERS